MEKTKQLSSISVIDEYITSLPIQEAIDKLMSLEKEYFNEEGMSMYFGDDYRTNPKAHSIIVSQLVGTLELMYYDQLNREGIYYAGLNTMCM